MEFYERPLLSYADLSLVLLKTGLETTTLEAVVGAVRRLLKEARQEDLPSDEELYRHLGRIRQDLTTAGLVEPVGADGFRISARGRQALDEHPMGLDRSVLTDFPEYQATLPEEGRWPGAARQDSYSEGYTAFLDRRRPEDNPYQSDSADHQTWQDGWSEARDEQGALPDPGPRTAEADSLIRDSD